MEVDKEPKINNLSKWELCRVCLITGEELVDMDEKLQQCYLQLTISELETGEKLPDRVCWSCLKRLYAVVDFMDIVQKSRHLLENNVHVLLNDAFELSNLYEDRN